MRSDRFWPCDIETLLKWILEEEKHGQIFGIQKDLFFIPQETTLSGCAVTGSYWRHRSAWLPVRTPSFLRT